MRAINTKKSIKEPKRPRAPVKRSPPLQEFENDEESTPRMHFSVFARFTAFVLFMLFLGQPVAAVFADDEVTDEPPVIQIASLPVDGTRDVVEDGPEAENQTPEDVPVVEEKVDATVAETESVPEMVEEGSVALSNEASTTNTSSTEEVASSTEVITEQGTETTTESDEEATTRTPEVVKAPMVTEESSTTPEIVEEVATTTTESENGPTTTPEVTVEQPLVQNETNDQNRYQFGVDECVTVENGFYYCSKNTVPKISAEDKVYAAQDSDGDFEIFISKDGVDTQITHNLYDDSAPYYDAKSDRLAWHAYIDDRYQIMMYDFNENQMEKFTSESYNNMQPAVLGSRVVWQAWINNNWEIMLDDDGVRTQLTNNQTQDIDPHIRGNLISWQSTTGETQDITVYNMETKEVDVIAGAGGSEASNPRFLLVYDSAQENGDTETIGYDLETGKTVPLSAIPESAPKEIPEPEHSKEKVAFVQTNPSLKDEGDSETDTASSTDILGDDTEATTTVAFEQGDVVIPSIASSSATTTAVEPAQITTIDMTAATSASSTESVASVLIPDLVIPVFVSEESEGE